VPIDRIDAVPVTVDHTLTCYILWEFTLRAELRYYVDSHLFFEVEEPRHDLEFLLTPIEYDGRGNVRQYNVEQVHPMEVKEDWEDHSGMSSEEIEVYQIFLNELELTSKEESDNSSEDMS